MHCYYLLIRKHVGENEMNSLKKKKKELEVTTVDNYLEVSDRRLYGTKAMLTKVLVPKERRLYQEVKEKHATSFIKHILLPTTPSAKEQLIWTMLRCLVTQLIYILTQVP